MGDFKILTVLPFFFKLLLIKNEKNIIICIYNNTLIFNMNSICENNFIYFNKFTNTLILKNNATNYKLIKNTNIIRKFLFFWNSYLFTKIKFKGKGYKIIILRRKKKIIFFFNTSHINIFIWKKMKIKRINKNKFILYNKNKIEINKASKNIINVRLLNQFTLRGLRKSKQIIFKRKGKKSSYI